MAVLALFILWFAYYVPHRIKQRQQLLDSRVEDRFSGSLRVLAVASGRRGTGRGPTGPGSTRPREARARCSWDRSWSRSRISAPAPSLRCGRPTPHGPQVTTGSPPTAAIVGGGAADHGDRRPRERPSPEHPAAPSDGGAGSRSRRRVPAAKDRVPVAARAPGAPRQGSTSPVGHDAPAAAGECGAWVAVGFGVLTWYAAVGPTAVLALVLVMGRQAVLAGAGRTPCGRPTAVPLLARRPERRAVLCKAALSPRATPCRLASRGTRCVPRRPARR
ncbi:hypothetical protein NKG05_19320 [Oerskovia sp. M15]